MKSGVLMETFPVKNLAQGLLGALVGGAIGCFVFKWIAGQGFYTPIPGALTGLGFGLAARRQHPAFGVIGAVLGLYAGLAAEWMTFKSDKGLAEFLSGLAKEPLMTWIMLALGTVLAFSFSVHRDGAPRRPENSDSTTDGNNP